MTRFKMKVDVTLPIMIEVSVEDESYGMRVLPIDLRRVEAAVRADPGLGAAVEAAIQTRKLSKRGLVG